jgi:multidrug resistance efflux pump
MSQSDNHEGDVMKDKLETMKSKTTRKRKWPLILLFVVVCMTLFHFFLSMTQIKLEGKVVAVRQLEIQSVADGILKEIHVENAQSVKKSDLLFQFENQELELKLKQTEEKKRELAEKQIHTKEVLGHTTKMVERAKILFENGVVTKVQLEETTLENSKHRNAFKEAEVGLKTVEFELDSLRTIEDSLNIRASFDGIFIGNLDPKKDTYFKKGKTIGLLFDPTQFYLEAYLPETKVLDLKVGDFASVTFKGLRGIYGGPVVQMDQRVTEETEKVFKTKHVIRALIQLEHSPAGLKPGMRGIARIVPNRKTPRV